jgi:excisionase family DNA binding protein
VEPFAFACPAWVPAGVRARLNAAVSELDDAIRPPVEHIFIGPEPSRPDPRIMPKRRAFEAAAVASLRPFVEIVIAVLSDVAAREPWEPALLRRTAYDLVEQRIGWTHGLLSQPIASEVFHVQCYEVLQQCPAWVSLMEAPATTPAAPPKPAAEDPRPLLSLKVAAERLKVHEDTLRRMGERGEIRLVRVGKKIHVSPAEIDRLLASDKYRYRS